MNNLTFLEAIWKDKEVATQVTKRDISIKYKGSQLGAIWAIVNPLIMLTVYTIVFSKIFQAKWGGGGSESTDTVLYALNLFAGLIVFNIFGETLNRSPGIITSNPNFVKKIRFPLHSLGEMIVYSATYQAVLSLFILLTAKTMYNGLPSWNLILLPIIWTILGLKCLGLSWIMATIGVFIRDIAQVTNVGTSMLMFLSPIFYPLTALPENVQWIAALNPIAVSIIQTRIVVLQNGMPSMLSMVVDGAVSLLWCEIAFRVLTRCQKTFGDYV